MKKCLGLIIMLAFTVMTQAQTQWKILLNNQLILSAESESEVKNKVKISASAWQSSANLEINFQGSPKPAWLHSIHITDMEGVDKFIKDSTMHTRVSVATLKKSLGRLKEFKIILVISPPDPLMMAPTRMIHLATLKLP